MENLENLELTQIQHNENYLLVINYPDTCFPSVITGTGKELIDFIFENEDSFDDDEVNLPEIEKLQLVIDRHEDVHEWLNHEWLPQLNLFKIKK